MVRFYTKKLLVSVAAFVMFITNGYAQFPGCPDINAGPDQVLPCSQSCTNLTATPFHTGAPTTYSVSSIPHSPPIPYNQAGGTAVSVNTDDVWSPIATLPFNFCYYGVNYTTVNIGSNGSIQFGPAAGGGFNPWSFTASCPSAALTAAGDVFGVYHDTDPSVGGTIKWYLLGTAPCRIFVVSWNTVPQFDCNNLISTSMIVLYETTNAIDVYVQSKPTCTTWNGGRAVIGIQNPTGTQGVAAPGRNTGNWTVTTPEAWRFTPNGTPNYVVNWYQGATQIGTGNTINVCPGGPATYTAQVTYTMCNGTQITDQDQVSISYTNLTPPTVTPTAESCNNYNNGSVVIDNPVGSGPYTVNITGPATASFVEPNTAAGVATFTNLPDGNYNYTVTGSNGCTTSGSFTITPGPNCCTVTASGTNILCNGGTTGMATANPTGVSPFSYLWSGGGQTSQTATNLAAGSYTVTLTDGSGCVATANVTLTSPVALTGSTTFTNASCNGTCNGSITATASGGTAPYQYSLNGGAFQASGNFTGLCAGTYTIVARDANNCTVTLNRTITQPPILTLTQTTVVPATCGANNGSVTVSAGGGTPGYQYSIGGPNQASPTFNSLAPGAYTIIATDLNGCTQTLAVTINAVNTPVASIISQQNVSCFGGSNGSVLIGATGGVAPITYSLNGGTFQSSNSFSSLAAGTYTVTVKDVNNCTSTVSVTITSPTQLTFTSTMTPVTCNGLCNGQVLINASGGTMPYQFSSNNGTTYGAANPLTGLCAGPVNLVVQDANGCLANGLVNMTQPAVLTATFSNTNPICEDVCDGQIAVTASGGSTPYQYSINGGALQTGSIITGVCGDVNNAVMVQDANGCQFTSVQMLTDPPGYGIDTVNIVESNCGFNNGEITVAANGLNGPFQYSFEGGPFQASGTFSNLFGGAYSIVAIDQLGCMEQEFIGVNDVEMDGIVLLETDATCYGTPNGAIEVTNVSGALPITFELDNSGTTQTNGIFTNLAQGSHVVTIYDGGLCVYTLPFITDQPQLITFTTTVTDVACNAGNSGAISFTNLLGGTGTYQYSIDNGTTFQTGTTFTGLAAGTYNLAVMDANNCVVYGTAVVGQAPPLAYSSSVFDLTCFGNNTGVIQLSATGGMGGYQYSIDNGATFSTTDSYFSLTAGTYDIAVQDAALCQITGTLVVNEPATLLATYVTTAATCNGVCDGQLAITASGGTLPYQYSVDNGVTFVTGATIAGLCANTYAILVKDSNNCQVTSTEIITEPSAVNAAITLVSATCSAANGEIHVVASGGTPNYQYSIDNGVNFGGLPDFTLLSAGNYSVVVRDLNNCEVSSLETILNEASPVITDTYLTDVSCNAACDGELQVTATGGTGTLGYSIGGAAQAGNTFTNICAGNYVLTVSDQNGCTDTQPFTITEPLPLTLTATGTDLNCFNDNSGAVDFVAAGGTLEYFYSIDNGLTYSNQATIGFLDAGTYNVAVKDNHDCVTTAQVVINEPPALIIQNIATTNVSCYGLCDGDATLTVTGGTGAPNYAWGNGITGGNAVTGLCTGSYDVIVSDQNGCEADTNVQITEPPMLVIVSVTATDVLCNSNCDGTITINSPQAIEFSVDGGVTFQTSNVFTGLCAGTYNIVVRDAIGCPQTETVVISEPLPLVQNLIPEDGITICYDGYGTLSASADGGVQPYYYIWNTGDTTQYLNVNLTQPATFTCTVVDQNGCISNQSTASVAIRPPFIASVTSPVSTCPGGTVSATASGVDGLPGYTYQWLTPALDTLSEGATYGYSPATSEFLLMVGSDACYRYDTLQVQVIVFDTPQPDFNVDPSSGCAPLDAAFDNLLDPGTVASATWYFGDGTSTTGNTNISHQYTEVGCYDVTLEVISVDGCAGDTVLQNVVCVVPDPIANFTFSPNIPTTVNSQVMFFDQSTNAVEYDWDFQEFGTSSLENPSVNYGDIEPGEHLVCLTVTSPEGCQNDTCKTITFVEEMMIHVPNTFTPDDDEFNPVFVPVLPEGIEVEDYTLYIFDRWGEILFESHDYQIGWDGTYHGETAKEGVYTWTIQMTGGPRRDHLRFEGHVTLLR